MKTSKWKMSLVPVLAVMLVWILTGGSKSETAPAAAAKTRLPEIAPPGAQTGRRLPIERRRSTANLERAVARNPFARPLEADNLANGAGSTSPNGKSESAPSLPVVHAVIKIGGDFHAVVDGRHRRQGDDLGGSRRIDTIAPRGVVIGSASPAR